VDNTLTQKIRINHGETVNIALENERDRYLVVSYMSSKNRRR
jgi:hypothetical protein